MVIKNKILQDVFNYLPREGDFVTKRRNGYIEYSNQTKITKNGIPNILPNDTVILIKPLKNFRDYKGFVIFHESGEKIELNEKDIGKMIKKIQLNRLNKKSLI